MDKTWRSIDEIWGVEVHTSAAAAALASVIVVIVDNNMSMRMRCDLCCWSCAGQTHDSGYGINRKDIRMILR